MRLRMERHADYAVVLAVVRARVVRTGVVRTLAPHARGWCAGTSNWLI